MKTRQTPRTRKELRSRRCATLPKNTGRDDLADAGIGTICWQRFLRHWHLLAEACDFGLILQAPSSDNALASKVFVRSDHLHWMRDDDNFLLGHVLVWPRGLPKLVY